MRKYLYITLFVISILTLSTSVRALEFENDLVKVLVWDTQPVDSIFRTEFSRTECPFHSMVSRSLNSVYTGIVNNDDSWYQQIH